MFCGLVYYQTDKFADYSLYKKQIKLVSLQKTIEFQQNRGLGPFNLFTYLCQCEVGISSEIIKILACRQKSILI